MPCNRQTGRLTPQAACEYPIGHRLYKTTSGSFESFTPTYHQLGSEIDSLYERGLIELERARSENKLGDALARIQNAINEMTRLRDSIETSMP